MYEYVSAVVNIIDRDRVREPVISVDGQHTVFSLPQYPLYLYLRELLLESSHITCFHANTLSPIIERMSVVMKNMRQNVAGSLKNTMPTMTAPTAPIPVHTG